MSDSPNNLPPSDGVTPARSMKIPRESDPLGSPILCTVARLAAPLTLLVSLRIFWQGHNLPGGGFIAGVLAAAAGAMMLLGWGTGCRVARLPWWRVSVVGLLISLGTGAVLMLTQESGSFMDHTVLHLPIIGHLPTATFFDLGVYFIVLGTLMTIFVELGSEGHPVQSAESGSTSGATSGGTSRGTSGGGK